MPRISRYRMLVGIGTCAFMLLLLVSHIAAAYWHDWTSRVLGFDIIELSRPDSHYFDVVVPLVPLLFFVPMAVFCLWVRREKKAFARGKRPCLHCGYDLQGHAPVGRCSECGTPFEIAEIECYFTKLSDMGMSRSITQRRILGVILQFGVNLLIERPNSGCKVPRIRAYRKLLAIWMCGVITMFCIGYTIPWLCLDWSSRVFGYNMFTLTNEGSFWLYAIGAAGLVLLLAPYVALWRWVRREKRAFAQGKRPCLHCGFNLQAHGAVGKCRECGIPFEMAEIEWYFSNLSEMGRSHSFKQDVVIV